jgi:hypothetical protein
MAQLLEYTKETSNGITIVQVFENGKTFCTIECYVDSPYSIEEEIQNWLDDNGYEDKEFDFQLIQNVTIGVKVNAHALMLSFLRTLPENEAPIECSTGGIYWRMLVTLKNEVFQKLKMYIVKYGCSETSLYVTDYKEIDFEMYLYKK